MVSGLEDCRRQTGVLGGGLFLSGDLSLSPVSLKVIVIQLCHILYYSKITHDIDKWQTDALTHEHLPEKLQVHYEVSCFLQVVNI